MVFIVIEIRTVVVLKVDPLLKRVPWRSIDSRRLPVDCDQWKWYISRHFKPQNAAKLQPVDSNDGVCLSSIPFHHHHRFARQWNDYLLVREGQNHPPNLQLPHHKLGDRWLDHVPALYASKRGKEHKEPNIPLHFQGVTAAVWDEWFIKKKKKNFSFNAII